MARKALSNKNAPRSLRVGSLAFIWLFADRFDPTPMAWGFIYSAMAIIGLIWVIDFFTADDIEL